MANAIKSKPLLFYFFPNHIVKPTSRWLCITATIKGLYFINRMFLDSRSDLIIHSLPTKYTFTKNAITVKTID